MTPARRMLATDIDGTLLGGGNSASALARFMRSYHEGLCLCYVTSRPLRSTLMLIDSGTLPAPDYICASVGTLLFDYRARREIPRYVAQSTDHWNAASLRQLSCTGIVLQEAAQQAPYKVSYYWDGNKGSLGAFMARAGLLEGCRCIVSSGRYIDIIPKRMGKGAAVLFLSESLGIHGPSLLAAGDTETDIEMFHVAGGAVLPRGASAQTRQAALSMRSPVYQATRPYDLGIIDGVLWFWGRAGTAQSHVTRESGMMTEG